MEFWRNLNIRKKLMYSILALAVVLGLASTAFSLWRLNSALNDGLRLKAESLANLVADGIHPGCSSRTWGWSSASPRIRPARPPRS